MSDIDDDAVKPIKRISLRKRFMNQAIKLNNIINRWIKIVMCIRIREMFMLMG